MATATLQQITQILPTLAPDEQDSVLDYIELMRGKSVIANLSDQDRAELLRRASSIDVSCVTPLDQVIAESRAKLAKRER